MDSVGEIQEFVGVWEVYFQMLFGWRPLVLYEIWLTRSQGRAQIHFFGLRWMDSDRDSTYAVMDVLTQWCRMVDRKLRDMESARAQRFISSNHGFTFLSELGIKQVQPNRHTRRSARGLRIQISEQRKCRQSTLIDVNDPLRQHLKEARVYPMHWQSQIICLRRHNPLMQDS